MRALALHGDVLVVRSALLQVNCAIVRSTASPAPAAAGASPEPAITAPEAFVIDSPVLPEELESLPALIEQARFPSPSGLLATHGDWDHLLGRLAFPGLAVGCAESTARRLAERPGEAQRALRDFDEGLAIERPHPLALGSVQPLPVPGRCEIGDGELELHPTAGHTPDGMAIVVPWAGVLLAGDYLSALEIPTLDPDGGMEDYLATLERLRPLLARCEHVVPGHGPHVTAERALELLEEDASYLRALRDRGDAGLPAGRRSPQQRRLHAANVAALGGSPASSSP